MHLALDKRTALVCGGSSGLGFGVANWAKTLAAEVAADGVTVNSLMPGRFSTERTRRMPHG